MSERPDERHFYNDKFLTLSTAIDTVLKEACEDGVATMYAINMHTYLFRKALADEVWLLDDKESLEDKLKSMIDDYFIMEWC